MNFFKKILEKFTGKDNLKEKIKETEVQKDAQQQDIKQPEKITESVKEKSEEEIIAEINDLAPGIFSQAKTPEMKRMIIDIYKKMVADGVNLKNEKEVQKWMDKNAHLFQGRGIQKVETYRREKPKVGRNEPCPCGSGKKYKKCCGAKE